nr:hypothetical protein [Tanacetum cinerariifolium]
MRDRENARWDLGHSTWGCWKKYKPKRKPTKEPEVPLTESQAEHTVPLPSPSYDPLPSGADSLKLKELIDLCTNFSNKILDLESEVLDIKSTYKAKIEKLESKVERLKEENRVLKKLKDVHSTVDSDEPVMEKEESSKQERKIADINADVEINLEKVQDKAYNLDLDHQEKVLSMLDVNDDEPTITAAEATKVIVEVPKPRKRRGIIIQDPEETIIVTMQQKVQSKDKGKAILIEEPKPLKRQVQIDLDEENKGIKVPKKEVRQEKEVKVESFKIKGKSLEQEIAKKQKIEQETEELKNVCRLFYMMMMIAMMKNFDREGLESLWKIIRERFEKTKPKNYTAGYLLNTLKIKFEKPNVEDNIFLLVEKMYPLTHFTLEQMVNDVRLEVEDESEMSLELLRVVKR